MIKKTYTSVLRGHGEDYIKGWKDMDRYLQHLPTDFRKNDGTQSYLDYMKGYYDRGRFWMLQQEAT